jgi:hypothetical protein
MHRFALVASLGLALVSLAGCAAEAREGARETTVAKPSRVSYVVGGHVSGLRGIGLVLVDSAGDEAPVTADGTFAFATPLDDGARFEVKIGREPISPAQSCSVARARGRIAGRPSMDVDVVCTTVSFEDPSASSVALAP